MSTYCGRVQAEMGWVSCLVILIAALCLALEDTTHLLSIVPYLMAVALILGRATFSNGRVPPQIKIEHERLICKNKAAHDSFEFILAPIDPKDFYPFWNDRLRGRLNR